MHPKSEALPEILIMLAAAVAIVAVFRQFRLSPVLGFLFAGTAIGPSGFGLISNLDDKSKLAEYGVVFLLFMIGLELSFKRLAQMRSYVLGLGGLQTLITAGILGFATYQMIGTWKESLIIGGALALSSTAIVLQVLSESGERLTQVGRVSFSILLLQDLAVIPLLIIVPILGGSGGNLFAELGVSFLYALLVVVGLIIAGRLLLTPLLSIIARASIKNSELFVAATLLLALGAAAATEHFGLSQALGAFIAGLVIAETEFRKQVEVDIAPFKGILMGLFFMTVGMSFNLNELILKLPEVIALSALLIAIKAAVIVGVCRLFSLGWEMSFKTGFLLCQGSEFAFILFGLATQNGLLDFDLGQTLLLVVTFTMAITPLAYALVSYIYKRYQKNLKQDLGELSETSDLDSHFILCGFGWVGENLAKFFTAEGINFVVIEQDPKRVKAGREMGFPVYYGDASRTEMLNSFHIKGAKAVIITIHDSKPVKHVIQSIRKAFKQVNIIARAKHIENVDELRKAGATIVVPEAYESAMQIAKTAMQVIGQPDIEINRVLDAFTSAEVERAGRAEIDFYKNLTEGI